MWVEKHNQQQFTVDRMLLAIIRNELSNYCKEVKLWLNIKGYFFTKAIKTLCKLIYYTYIQYQTCKLKALLGIIV